MFYLGGLYLRGDGVQQDAGKARVWFEKSAAVGNEDAKTALSHLNSAKP